MMQMVVKISSSRRTAIVLLLGVFFAVQFLHNTPTAMKHYALPTLDSMGYATTAIEKTNSTAFTNQTENSSYLQSSETPLSSSLSPLLSSPTVESLIVTMKPTSVPDQVAPTSQNLSSTISSRDETNQVNSSNATNLMENLMQPSRPLQSIQSYDNSSTMSSSITNQADVMTNSSNTALLRNTSFDYADTLDWAMPHFYKLFRSHENRTHANCMESCLLETAVPFYVYPETSLFHDPRFHIGNLTNNKLDSNPGVRPRVYREGAVYEIAILHALMTHPWRTNSPQDAQLFVLPVAFGAISFSEVQRSENQRLFRETLQNLRKSRPFQQGKPHLFLSMTSPLFNPHHMGKVSGALVRLCRALKPAILVRTDDYIATTHAYLHNVTPVTDFRGFDEQFAKSIPMTDYQFSVGLGGEAVHMPLITPTWNKFQNSTFYIFYHTRTSAFLYNSTVYRHAPTRKVLLDALPHSSIGFGLEAAQWKQGFGSSKFCLVVRGDTPHSHALFNAIKVGCIPVIVSDWYIFFAPPFPATLDMRDFCIFLPEDYFLDHTEEALQSLKHIPDHVIQAKLEALAWAQRVVILDHPRSLFVEAFVREAMASLSRPALKLLNASYHT